MALGRVGERIAEKLRRRFAPSEIEVRDESDKHAGHSGARPEGETHFYVHIVAEAFDGKPRLERHRLVHETLREELAGPVHALSIVALGAQETRSRSGRR